MEQPPKTPGRVPEDETQVVVVGRARPKTKSERKREQEALRQEYMESPCILWAEFARKKGIEPYPSSKNPCWQWQQAKKDSIATKEAEELAGAVFSQGFKWNKEVVKTLDDYPKTIDTLYELTKRRVSMMVDTANRAGKGDTHAMAEFKNIKTSEFQTLANTLETLTRAKHKSLMIDGWDVKLAKQVLGEQADIVKDLEDDKWTIEVIGKDVQGKDIQRRMADWYDKPQISLDSDITAGAAQDQNGNTAASAFGGEDPDA